MLNIVIPPQDRSATSKKFSIWVLLCCAALAFALGWAAAQQIPYALAGKHDQAQNGNTAVSTAGAAKAGVALDALSQFKATDRPTQQPAGVQEQAAALPSTAPVRQVFLRCWATPKNKEGSCLAGFRVAKLMI